LDGELPLEGGDEHLSESDNLRGTTTNTSLWRIIAVVTTLTVVVLCATVLFNPQFQSNSGEGLKHLTELQLDFVPKASKKNMDLGFPIYVQSSGLLGAQSDARKWVVTFKGDAGKQKKKRDSCAPGRQSCLLR